MDAEKVERQLEHVGYTKERARVISSLGLAISNTLTENFALRAFRASDMFPAIAAFYGHMRALTIEAMRDETEPQTYRTDAENTLLDIDSIIQATLGPDPNPPTRFQSLEEMMADIRARQSPLAQEDPTGIALGEG
jgi:hypothetical protein